LDYFWLLAPIWASFGALLTGLILRRLDISRMSYRQAKQMLSAMVSSLSKRIEQNEAMTRELSDQIQILNANQARLRAEGQTADRERLLEYMQDWISNVRRFIEKVDGLQKNVRNVEQEFQKIRLRVDQLNVREKGAMGRPVEVGIVTDEAIQRLTDTERSVLQLLISGSRAAPEIGRLIGKSREHTARLMKSLFEQGFVERETRRQPYAYRLHEKVSRVLEPTVRAQAISPRD